MEGEDLEGCGGTRFVRLMNLDFLKEMGKS